MQVSWVMRSVAAVALLVGVGLAADVSAQTKASAKKQPVQRESVEMFSAIENGDIEVLMIPKDAKQSTVVIQNKTKKPLSVKMPEAFAGVPVLAQFGGGLGGGGLGGGGLGVGGGNQGLGGGFGGGLGGGGLGGGGGFGGGAGGGFFNVEPEKAKKVKVATVCLEHGKKDPNPNIKYQMIPIESFTQDAEVIEVCKMLGRGEVDQVSAQAATWHLANGLSWEELAAKIGVKHLNGSVEMFFHPQHIEMAVKIAKVAEVRAAESRKSVAGDKSDSLSQN